jgi:uncharacterized membrane protein YgaE (UPF0421/DUF939 family)
MTFPWLVGLGVFIAIALLAWCFWKDGYQQGLSADR